MNDDFCVSLRGWGIAPCSVSCRPYIFASTDLARSAYVLLRSATLHPWEAQSREFATSVTSCAPELAISTPAALMQRLARVSSLRVELHAVLAD